MKLSYRESEVRGQKTNHLAKKGSGGQYAIQSITSFSRLASNELQICVTPAPVVGQHGASPAGRPA